MSLIEFIGFVLSMLALTFLYFKRKAEERRRLEHPEEFQEEDGQKNTLNDFLRALEGDMEDYKQPKPPKQPPPAPPPKRQEARQPPQKKPQRVVSDQFQFQGKLEQYRPKTSIETRTLKPSIGDTFYQSFDERLLSKDFRTASTNAYDVIRIENPPRIQTLVKQLPSLKQMIIFKEIIGPPKGLQFSDEQR